MGSKRAVTCGALGPIGRASIEALVRERCAGLVCITGRSVIADFSNQVDISRLAGRTVNMKRLLEHLVKVAGFSFLSLGIGALFAVHIVKSPANCQSR